MHPNPIAQECTKHKWRKVFCKNRYVLWYTAAWWVQWGTRGTSVFESSFVRKSKKYALKITSFSGETGSRGTRKPCHALLVFPETASTGKIFQNIWYNQRAPIRLSDKDGCHQAKPWDQQQWLNWQREMEKKTKKEWNTHNKNIMVDR